MRGAMGGAMGGAMRGATSRWCLILDVFAMNCLVVNSFPNIDPILDQWM